MFEILGWLVGAGVKAVGVGWLKGGMLRLKPKGGFGGCTG